MLAFVAFGPSQVRPRGCLKFCLAQKNATQHAGDMEVNFTNFGQVSIWEPATQQWIVAQFARPNAQVAVHNLVIIELSASVRI